MRAYQLTTFSPDALKLVDLPDPPPPPPGHVCVRVCAISLNYRDLLVMQGVYNPKFKLPAIPISDGAGVVSAIGAGVTRVKPGDAVVGNFVSGWIEGPFRAEHLGTTLGLPGPGMAAEAVVLPADAVVPVPRGFSHEQAATLPIAALTAWSALITEGGLDPSGSNAGKTMLTLGTGGVSIFAVQFAKALGAKMIITSSDDRKLDLARALGAAHGISYRTQPDWEKTVLEITGGVGVDITVETGGAGTLERSMKATRHGGRIAMLGALTGLKSEITVGTILMKRLRICGIMVDSRSSFEAMIRFIEKHEIKPVIDRMFAFDELPAALTLMQSGGHFGKIVLTV